MLYKDDFSLQNSSKNNDNFPLKAKYKANNT